MENVVRDGVHPSDISDEGTGGRNRETAYQPDIAMKTNSKIGRENTFVEGSFDHLFSLANSRCHWPDFASPFDIEL
jgi:hypothetical protein